MILQPVLKPQRGSIDNSSPSTLCGAESTHNLLVVQSIYILLFMLASQMDRTFRAHHGASVGISLEIHSLVGSVVLPRRLQVDTLDKDDAMRF